MNQKTGMVVRKVMACIICMGVLLQPVITKAGNELPILPSTVYKYQIILPDDYTQETYGSVTYDVGSTKDKNLTATMQNPLNQTGNSPINVRVTPAVGKMVSFTDCNNAAYQMSTVSEGGTWSMGINLGDAPQNASGVIEIHVNFENVSYTYQHPVWTWNGTSSASAKFVANENKDYFVVLTGNLSSQVTKSANCTETGEEKYTAKVSFMGTEYTDGKMETKNALGHDLVGAVPQIQFSDDGKSAQLIRPCLREGCNYKDNLEANVVVTNEIIKEPTYTEKGKTKYTATTTYDEVQYIKSKTLDDIEMLPKKNISTASVSGVVNKNYTGNAQTQSNMAVKVDGATLKAGTDYTVAYANNKNIGTATITINGTGKYTGRVTKTFKITTSKGKTYVVNSMKYKVTKATSGGTVALTGTTKSKKSTSFSIGNTVKIGGQTFKITAISDKAFKNFKKLKKATIGSNVTSIGKEAFYGCKVLKSITIKSKKLSKVGKNAIKNIYKKATIKVPSSKVKAYKKLFKSSTGFKKGMKVKK